MKIYCDWDGLLYPLVEQGWLPYLNKKHGKEYVLEDVLHWNWLFDNFPKAGSFFQKEGRYSQCEMIEGAIEFVFNLENIGEVTILTASSDHMIKEKDELIKKYFNVPVIHDKDKHKYADGILIDDNFMNIYNYTKAGGVGILYTHNGRYRYNDFIWNHKDFHKAKSYEEILEILEKI